MVLNRHDNSITHRKFCQITDYIQKGDVLVFNDSRVIPARLTGRKVASDGKVEILLLRQIEPGLWETLVKPSKRVNVGTAVEITANSGDGTRVLADIRGAEPGGIRLISFSDETQLPRLGKIPLPPYIHTPLEHPERYQTVYARVNGSVAAPTAGLHFTPELLGAIKEKGVSCLFVTLHIGLDTFRPIREDDPSKHAIHSEYGMVSEEVTSLLSQAKVEGRRVIGVGTTVVRVLEHLAQVSGSSQIQPFKGWVDLFILPDYQFRMVDAMITNFHLPRTTLLLLVTAFAGDELIKRAYQEAISHRYRFYSFGDAMLIF